MSKNYCGTDCCENCGIKDQCVGCAETQGRPLGGECVVAQGWRSKAAENANK